ncbi:MAG: signal peptide peptidase SppA [candidate division Zixibacteria bacterium]|nr:signal peptide peptidase SppA [candidate division Zixibacteria bacterium]
MARTRDIVVGAVIIGVVFMFLMMIFISIWGITKQRDVAFLSGGDKVAIVELAGVIESSEGIVRQLKKYDDDNSVSAIVLRINSPGGAVAPSQEIYDQVLKARENGMFVVASLSSIAASGGYYVACAADTIIANPGSLTGSIGVVLSYLTFEGLMDKIGVAYEVVKSGDLKDVGNYSREMTQKEREMLQAALDDVHSQFIITVAESRNMDIEQVEDIADGSIFTGNQSMELGLVDKLGTLEDAISLAGIMADLGEDPRVVKEYPRRRNFLDYLAEEVASYLNIKVPNKTWPKLEYIYK